MARRPRSKKAAPAAVASPITRAIPVPLNIDALDHFAGIALSALLADPKNIDATHRMLAVEAYEIAEAMVVRRHGIVTEK